MQHLFDVTAELRTLERFGCKIVAQSLILQVLANLQKTFLAVDEGLDD
jgi:hypothetical protein